VVSSGWASHGYGYEVPRGFGLDATMAKARPTRVRNALILAGICLGVLSYIVLLVIVLPLLLGPWAFALAALVSLELVVMARALSRPATPPRFVWLPGRAFSRARQGSRVAWAVAAAFVLRAFAIVLLILSETIQVFPSPTVPPWLFGIFGWTMARFGIVILEGLYFGGRFPGPPFTRELPWDEEDTTADR